MEVKKVSAKVLKAELLCNNIKLIRLKVDNSKDFLPGNSIALHIDNSQKYFSVVYSSFDYVDIMVKLTESKSTIFIFNMKEDDTVEISGPHSKAFDLSHSDHLTFIAGGSGIANFLYALKCLYENKSAVSVNIIFSSRHPEEFVFKKDLDNYSKTSNFRTHYVVTKSEPRINQEYLHSFVKDNKGIFYICGPKSMISDVASYLKNLKVPEERIIYDKY
ncbi:MAG: FAD-dependent oxidoreductase [Nanoarchaeota archaeon]